VRGFTEETELVTKSEQDMKLLQQSISQLQLELRAQTKNAKESQQPRVGNICLLGVIMARFVTKKCLVNLKIMIFYGFLCY